MGFSVLGNKVRRLVHPRREYVVFYDASCACVVAFVVG